MPAKTNAVRRLDQLSIRYQLVEYDVDPDDLTAETVAAKIGLPIEAVYKTLCVRGDKTGCMFAVIPGDHALDLKALARCSGNRKVEPVKLKELSSLTGYIRGGVTVLGARKPFPAFVDELIELHEIISVSAGKRGMQMWLAPADYIRATDATVVDIAVEKN